MKIARFLDTQGTIHLGTPIDAGHARPLGGHLYEGLTETTDEIRGGALAWRRSSRSTSTASA
jgi:hypothetical protein